jgi:hypothetical protein
MKITKKQLRRLIAEAFKQKVPLFGQNIAASKYANKIKGNLDHFDPVELDSMRFTGRKHADTASLSATQKKKLAGLASSEPNVERSIYQSLGSTEPMTTVEEDESVFAGQDSMYKYLSDYNLHQALEDIFVNGNNNEAVLRQLGFVKVSDFSHLQPGAEEYEDYYKEQFKEQGNFLEKMPQDLMFIDTEENDEMWDKITEFLENDERIVATSIFTEYGGGTQAVVSKKKHKRVALIDYHHGGYGVMTV